MNLNNARLGLLGLAAAFLVAFAGLAQAANFPRQTGYVTDQAGLLDAEQRADLTRQLARYRQSSGNEVVVFTVSSLGGLDIADYGRRLGNAGALVRPAGTTVSC